MSTLSRDLQIWLHLSTICRLLTHFSVPLLLFRAPYISKNKMALEHCLTALSRAQAHVEKNPSKAEDTGTAKRTVQHMFQRVLNTLYCHREISDTQVALALLSRLGTEATSESFGYYGAGYMRNFIEKELELAAELEQDEPPTDASVPPRDDGSGVDSDSDWEMDASSEEEMETDDDSTNSALHYPVDTGTHIPTPDRAELGPAPFYKAYDPASGDIKSIPIPYQYHWRMRGEELRMMTPAEYYALVDVKKIPADAVAASEDSDDTDDCDSDSSAEAGEEEQQGSSAPAPARQRHGGGRRKSRIFLFDETHPLYRTHCQYLKTKQPTLIINGYAPRHPGPPPERPKKRLKHYKRHYRAWKKKADAFALYYLSTYRPLPNHYSKNQRIGDKSDFSWEALCQWVEEMEQSSRVVDKMRLDAMYNDIYGFRSKSRHQKVLSDYRSRNRRMWTKEELAENKELFASFKTYRQDMMGEEDPANDQYNASTIRAYRPADVTKVYQEVQYCREQKNALDSIYGSFHPTASPHSQEAHDAADGWKQIDHFIIQDQTAADVRAVSGRIKKGRVQEKDPPGNASETEGGGGDSSTEESASAQSKEDGNGKPAKSSQAKPTPSETITSFLDQSKLLQDQRRVVDRIRQYFDQLGAVDQRNPVRPEPPRLLMTGDPGAGKSYVIETIVEMAERMNAGHVQTTSFNGIAAVNIDGVTLLSLLGIGRNVSSETDFASANKSLEPDQLRDIRAEVQASKLALFVVDEVSTLDSVTIAMIDARLQAVMGVAEPFGGVGMLFVGDFNQLGAVKKTFLLDDMVNWAEYQASLQEKIVPPKEKAKRKRKKSKLDSAGRPVRASREKMFRAADRIFQKRKQAKQKKVNTSLYSRYTVRGVVHRGCQLFSQLERYHIRGQIRSKDKRHTKFVTKLADGNGMMLEDLKPYQPLTKKDLKDAAWKFAPILVTTNRERMAIVEKQSALFAQLHGTYVFKWRNDLSSWNNKPSDTSRLFRQNPMLWQFFVPGCDAFLSRNINTNLGLANGTPVVCHSVVLDPLGDDYHRVQSMTSGPDRLPFGSEIVLESPPLAVNMVIQRGLDGKEPSKHKIRQFDALQKYSIVPPESEEIIIPISQKGDKPKAYKMRNGSPLLNNISEVQVKTALAFDLAFAMTIHKAQGRTIPRVVIALTERPYHLIQMEFASVFVGMSRVACSDHIRLLPHVRGTLLGNRVRAHNYLTGLLPMKSINIFNAGFTKKNGLWNWRKCLKAKF